MEVSPFSPSDLFHKITSTPEDHTSVVCLCGEQYVYPVAVRVARGATVSETTSNGARQTGPHRLKSAPVGRGATIEVEFNCESGHKFVQVLQFHKGETFAHLLFGHAEPLPTSDLTIWRG
jgi:hypothetical protein